MTPLISMWAIECCGCQSEELGWTQDTRDAAIQNAIGSGWLELANPNDSTDKVWLCPDCLALNATEVEWYNGWTAVDHALRKENEWHG